MSYLFTGPAQAPAGPVPVVVRNRWWLRVAGVPLLALGAVCLALAAALPTAPHIAAAAKVFLVVLMLLVGVCGFFGGTVAVRMLQTFSPTQITMRKYARTFVIDASTASRIRQVRAAVHAGRMQVPIGRLQIVGDESSRRMAPRAIVDETLTNAEEAMACLDEWVRRRPELVASDPAARAVFVNRGVLPR